MDERDAETRELIRRQRKEARREFNSWPKWKRDRGRIAELYGTLTYEDEPRSLRCRRLVAA